MSKKSKEPNYDLYDSFAEDRKEFAKAAKKLIKKLKKSKKAAIKFLKDIGVRPDGTMKR